MRLEGVLADQRQRGRNHLRRFAGENFEIRQFVRRREIGRRHHDRQMAEAGVLGQHGEEGVDHARAKAFGEHDAVDVAGVEMTGRRLDAERADHAGLLAERHRQRRVGAAAADQQHGGVARGIDIRQRHPRGRHQPAHHGRMQRRGSAARRAGAPAGDRNCPGLEKTEWRCREAGRRDRPRSAADRVGRPRPARPAAQVGRHRYRRRQPAPRPAAPARRRAPRPPTRLRRPETAWRRRAPTQRTARVAVDTTRIGPCWDIWITRITRIDWVARS